MHHWYYQIHSFFLTYVIQQTDKLYFLLSTTLLMPLVLYNGINIYRLNKMNTHIYIHSAIQHTYTHSYRPTLRGRYSLISCIYAHSHLCGSCDRTILPLSRLSISSFVVHEMSTSSATLDPHQFSFYCFLFSRLWCYLYLQHGIKRPALALDENHNPTQQFSRYKTYIYYFVWI